MSLKISGIDQINLKMVNLDTKTKASMRETMSAVMAEAEREAKSTAPWVDRTGNARNSISGRILKENDTSIEGVLSIGVDYGKYLELRWGGRYRVIQPVIEWSATRVSLWASNLLK